MNGFGVHTSMWTMTWDPLSAEKAISAAASYGLDFVEIALLDLDVIDPKHTRKLLEKHGLRAVGSLGMPEGAWSSRNPDAAIAHLNRVIDVASEMGAEAVSGVIYGGIGERSGKPPTQAEYDNVARAIEASARHAATKNMELGVEAVNRYETHLFNTAAQTRDMVERIGLENVFIHLDTYHMNIEEKGVANGILAARDHLRYMHLSESDRGTPGEGTCNWDEIYGALAAIGFKGGLAMESFINMPPELEWGLSVWRPVAPSFQEVMDKGLPFLRNKAQQYGLI